MKNSNSIFNEYYKNVSFIDRYLLSEGNAVDVIIPLIHTNELWESNLNSIFREVPVNRLLISDGGCTDNSISIVKKYPRVTILSHQNYISLGFCLKKLIEEVETEWFIYLHSDVYLPENWFDIMKKHQSNYDWYGCPQRITAMVEYYNIDKIQGAVRPYAGSQMGRKQAFIKGIEKIEDDYVYRQEDLILASIIEENGYRHGRIEDTYHYHQVMHKESPWSRKLKRVVVEVDWSKEEIIRSTKMQLLGIVKYLQPTKILIKELEVNIFKMIELGELDKNEFKQWVHSVNPVWSPYIEFNKLRIKNSLFQIIAYLKIVVHKLLN